MTYGRPGVYVNETLLPAPINVTGTANAAGAAIGAFAKGPETLTYVNSWSNFVSTFGALDVSFPATFGVQQFFANGGTELYVRRVLHSDAVAATVTLPTDTDGTLLVVSALNKGADGNNLRVRVTGTNQANYYNLVVSKEVVASKLGTADANQSDDLIVEQFNNVRFDDALSSDFAATVVNATSRYISLGEGTGTPATQAAAGVLPLAGGNDGTAPTKADYIAVLPADGTAEFDTVDRPLVIFAPELFSVLESADAADVLDAMIDWANAGSGFAVVETAPGLTPAEAISYITSRSVSSHAAAYYPHYFISDPVARSRQALRKVGPASAVAGLYLATDRAAGPFKTPAGLAAGIRTAVSLERAFTPADLDSLNTGVYVSGDATHYGVSVNAVRNVPGNGVVVMGGRTLQQDGTANRYINIRRSLIYIEKQLKDLTQFAVFQNNDYKLWRQISNVISVFLNEYRNQGGLRGTSPSQAYFVTVDGTNNTPESIANGVVNISVGVALEYPAEFIVINLSQVAGQ